MTAGDPTSGRRDLAIAVAVLAAAAVALYGPGLRRGFTAEDFLLVRFLGEHPPWREPLLGFSGPWLGITAVGFWRPLATLFFALEVALFGAAPLGYQLVHLLVHGAVAVTLARWVRRLAPGPGGNAVAVAVGVAFLAHPAHPNAVQFPASFATLAGGGAIALALVAWERERDTGRLPWRSLGAFVAGLASYEAVVVLPGMLVARELLLAPGSARPRRVVATFGTALVAYLGLRAVAVGAVLGGYAETRGRLLGAVPTLASDVVTSLARLAWPLAGATPASPAAVISILAVLAVVAGLCVTRGPAREPARGVAFALVVALLGIAPIGFQPPVLATGRYLYVACFGGALLLAAGSLAAGGRARRVAAVATVALACVWAGGLAAAVRLSVAGGETAGRIGTALAATAASPGERVFVSGYPLYLRDAAGVPVAPVLHYGVRDLARPPFAAQPVDAYPAPALAAEALTPLAAVPGARLVRWTGHALEAVPWPPVPPLGVLRDAGRDGAGSCRVAMAGSPGVKRQKLVLAAAGNATVVEAPAGAPLAIPGAFVQTMRRLYPGLPIYIWAVGEAEDGRVLALSAVAVLPEAPADGTGQDQNRSPSPCV